MSDLDFFASGRKAKVPVKKQFKEETEVNDKPSTQVEYDEKEKLSELKDKLEAEIILENQIDHKKVEYDKKNNESRYKAEKKAKRERVFDKYVQKKTQINEDDYLFLSNIEKSISFARKKVDIDAVAPRMTSNTLIRLVVENFVDKIRVEVEKDSDIYKKLQTEDSIRDFIKKL